MNPKKLKEFNSIFPGAPLGATVIENDVNYAIQSWKRRVKNSGIMKDIYERREFVKPSIRRKRILSDAEYKQKKESGVIE